MKRLFDIFSASMALLLLLPAFIVISIFIVFESRGGIFYLQTRVGRYGKEFRLFKFRTMRTNADKAGQLTVGMRDSRITRVGYFLRRYKLDELPQLLNVVLGSMSIIGPRPEVPKYVALYTADQRRVLLVRPGLSDLASLAYINENELLEKADNPEEYYIKEIMPAKLALNLVYIAEQGLLTDIKIIFATLRKIVA